MICPNCGTESKSQFCPNCGASLQQASTSQTSTNASNMGSIPPRNPGFSGTGGAPQKKKHSALGIISFILSFLGPLAVIGLILAIVDLAKDKKKEYKHGLSIAAIVISLIMCYAIGSSKNKDKKSKESDSTSSVEASVEAAPSEVTTDAEVTEEDSESKSELKEITSVTTKQKEEDKEEEEEKPEPESEPEEPAMSKEEFIATCTDLPYKDVARNPDDYIGQNFKFTAYVMSASEGGLFTGFQKYYKTFGFDRDKAIEKMNDGWADSFDEAKMYGWDSDQSVWLLDNRKEDDPDYIKILEKDTITVYGTFTGLQESKNALTGEKGEQVALDIKYVELIEE